MKTKFGDRRAAWTATVAALALAAPAAPAAAQDQDGQGSNSGQASGQAPVLSEDGDEIVVTAQRRSEVLQDVPISITVLGGDELDRSTSAGVSEALNRVPGVVVSTAAQTGGSVISMRGITSQATFSGSSVAGYYLDTVPFGFVRSAVLPDGSIYDLERIEVLRGPQGTLYGANALNGVVRVLTHHAELDEFSAKGRTSLSATEGGGAQLSR